MPVLVGESAAIRELRKAVDVVRNARATVLVTGETGTGKGLVARCLHASSRGPFVHVDCASLSPTVIESELFGHERGAFTGAHASRRGRLEQAGRGTLFLDEVAEIEPALQAKLLRVLQDREFERVGGSRRVPFLARVVAATNRDLGEEMAAGRFRRDLYYRLQVVELHVPPLRERGGDVRLLFEWALRRVHAAARPAVAEDFLPALEQRAWPGNVRELLNLVERLVVSGTPEPWDAGAIGSLLTGAAASPAAAPLSAPGSRSAFHARERTEIAALLAHHRWNVSAAARSAGLSRGSLRRRMARLGLR